jgi:hypothetical protein
VTCSCRRTQSVPVAFAREICVPVRALRELPDAELRALLAHEAAHVVRRDAVWLMIAAAVRALGWWQPLNLVAAARLRLAMELCCDERAAADPSQRAALARCLIKVAEWNVRPGNDDGAVLATMASRGSALRRRLESLLDAAPRRRRAVSPWLAVTTVAVPVVCLEPLVTIASLSRVPAAAARLVRHASAPGVPAAPAARSVPFPRVAEARPAARRSPRAAAAPPSAVVADRAAAPEIALDEPPLAATPEPMPSAAGLERVAASAVPATRLRDAIAAARIPPEPAASRTRFVDIPDLEWRVWSWIRGQRGTAVLDPQRPKYETR